MKRKINGQWFLYSKDGSKKLGGPYDTEAECDKRERLVNYFKARSTHKG